MPRSYTWGMKMYQLVILAWACTLSVGAQAQWQWLDKDGRKVFSDLAPPPDIPLKNILHQPGGMRARPIAETPAAPAGTAAEIPGAVAATPAAAAPATLPAAAPAAGTDKELQQRKAQLDAQEESRKKAEDAKNAALRADNCSRAQRAKGTYASGQALRQPNAKGEMVFMDEAARALEMRRIQSVIESDCRPRQ